MLDSSSIVSIVIFLAVLFMSISLHEMMHAFVAYRLGDDLAHSHGRISLNPMRHIDPMLTIVLPAFMLLMGMPPILAAKPVPINTSRISGDEIGLAVVGIAGPLTNLFIATLAAVFYNFANLDAGVIKDIVQLVIELNVALFVFNMIPLPPLDGSRLLYAVAPRRLQLVMEQIEQMGMFVVIMMLFLLLSILNPILVHSNQFILNILIR